MERVIVDDSGGLGLDEAIEALEELREIDEERDSLMPIKLYPERGDGTQIVLDGSRAYVRSKW